jgi:D-glycero-alpha-D-manno-heptose-7-phosphate kinase
LGIAGGGTDVSPYSDQYGGYVLNVTINLYAYCTIELLNTPTVIFEAQDMERSFLMEAVYPLPLDDDGFVLHKAVYNRIMRQFNDEQLMGLRMVTRSDAPPGSGLGSSSSMVVAMLAAFQELMALPFGAYDKAHLAYDIERVDCAMAGGKQDQYAATFGGFNFMEFYADNRVVVNPLRVRRHIENELQSRLMLYFTGVSRESARIIEEQVRTAKCPTEGNRSLDAMHEIKQGALQIKERLLKGDMDGISQLFRDSWEAKKRTSASISNSHIEVASNTALEVGAHGIKVSGAGGGGFMMILADPNDRVRIEKALSKLGGYMQKFQFSHEGAIAWRVR